MVDWLERPRRSVVGRTFRTAGHSCNLLLQKEARRVITPVTIELPDALAKQAADSGLLTPEAIEAMLRSQLRRGGIRALLNLADETFVRKGPPMTLEEIQVKVDVVRAEKRRRAVRP